MSKLVGVDIGSTMVRVVELAGVNAEGFALISRIGLAQLPRGAVIAGQVREPKAVSTSLVRALRDAGVARHGFVLGLTSPDATITTMAFPASVQRKERVDAIRTMNRPIASTFGLEESSLATYLAGATTADDGSAMSTVGVAAARAEDVEALNAVCAAARCSPQAIDLSGAGLLRGLARVNPLAPEISTVVDVGATKVTVATRQGSYLRALRTTVGAGDEITQSLASAENISFEEAEELKFGMALTDKRTGTADTPADPSATYDLSGTEARPSTSQDDPDLSTLSVASDMLVDAIAQSVEGGAAAVGSMTQGVTLCGGTALLRGFRGRLQQRLGVPVSIARPWAELEQSKRNRDYFHEGRPDPRLLLTLSTAIGLALWKEPA